MKAYEEVVEFIASRNPREVVAFKPSEATRRRVADLIQREKISGLSAEERCELDDYEKLELLMNLAKARARQMLAHGH
ncbi:MAG: hypothetical protein ACK45B_06410 [Limisphaerales bacterium]|jgi:hypothetical protein